MRWIIMMIAGLAALAQGYSISGFVRDSSGNPVSGAKVFIAADTGVSTLSAGDGSLTLGGPTGLNRPAVRGVPLQLSLRGEVLSLVAPYATPATCALYTAAGRLVQAAPWLLRAGYNQMTVKAPAASGIYFLAVTGRDLSAVARMVFLEGRGLGPAVHQSLGAEAVRRDWPAKALAGGAAVSVGAGKSGYLNAYVPSADPATGLVIVMRTTLPATGGSGTAPTVAKALWQGNRRCVVTATFDDNYDNQLTAVRPLFESYGYRCTFYLITGRITNWSGWKAAADAGFEIGNHTADHDGNETDADIIGGKTAITANIGTAPLTFAWPGGSTGSEATVRANHFDSRHSNHCEYFDREYPEGDQLSASDMVFYLDKMNDQLPHYNNSSCLRTWLLFYMHNCTADRITALTAMLDYARQKDDSIWVAPYGQATLYQQSMEHTTLQVRSYTSQSITFTALLDQNPIINYRNTSSCYHCGDTNYYKVPLTMVINPGSTAPTRATAYRAANTAPVNVQIKNSRILVDIAPSAAPVRVVWE